MPRERELQQAIGKINSLVLPTAALVSVYTTDGCPTDCGLDWLQDHIEADIQKGPHASALEPDALKALHEETTEKVQNKYAKIVCFGEICQNLPDKLKISPVAMIPHKSRLF